MASLMAAVVAAEQQKPPVEQPQQQPVKQVMDAAAGLKHQVTMDSLYQSVYMQIKDEDEMYREPFKDSILGSNQSFVRNLST